MKKIKHLHVGMLCELKFFNPMNRNICNEVAMITNIIKKNYSNFSYIIKFLCKSGSIEIVASKNANIENYGIKIL